MSSELNILVARLDKIDADMHIIVAYHRLKYAGTAHEHDLVGSKPDCETCAHMSQLYDTSAKIEGEIEALEAPPITARITHVATPEAACETVRNEQPVLPQTAFRIVRKLILDANRRVLSVFEVQPIGSSEGALVAAPPSSDDAKSVGPIEHVHIAPAPDLEIKTPIQRGFATEAARRKSGSAVEAVFGEPVVYRKRSNAAQATVARSSAVEQPESPDIESEVSVELVPASRRAPSKRKRSAPKRFNSRFNDYCDSSESLRSDSSSDETDATDAYADDGIDNDIDTEQEGDYSGDAHDSGEDDSETDIDADAESDFDADTDLQGGPSGFCDNYRRRAATNAIDRMTDNRWEIIVKALEGNIAPLECHLQDTLFGQPTFQWGFQTPAQREEYLTLVVMAKSNILSRGALRKTSRGVCYMCKLRRPLAEFLQASSGDFGMQRMGACCAKRLDVMLDAAGFFYKMNTMTEEERCSYEENYAADRLLLRLKAIDCSVSEYIKNAKAKKWYHK